MDIDHVNHGLSLDFRIGAYDISQIFSFKSLLCLILFLFKYYNGTRHY
jgi:hypothetical protein